MKTSAIAASGQEHVKLTLKLWAEPHVSFKGQWHAIEDAGINPLLHCRRIARSTFGLVVTRTRLRRIAKWGDGWVMLAHSSGPVAMPRIRQARQYMADAGHDPSTIGLEVWVSTGEGGPDDWRRQFQAWNDAGVTHVSASSTYVDRGPHKRIADKTMAHQLAAMTSYRAAIADLL